MFEKTVLIDCFLSALGDPEDYPVVISQNKRRCHPELDSGSPNHGE